MLFSRTFSEGVLGPEAAAGFRELGLEPRRGPEGVGRGSQGGPQPSGQVLSGMVAVFYAGYGYGVLRSPTTFRPCSPSWPGSRWIRRRP